MPENSVDYKLGRLTQGMENIQLIFKEHTESDTAFQKEINIKLDVIIANKNIAKGKQLGYGKVVAVAVGAQSFILFLVEVLPKVLK